MSEHKVGSILLVGAGPGDPGLLTLKAARALAVADVVLYDALVSPQVLEMARKDAQKVPVGKKGHGPSCRQADINSMMVELALAGKTVLRLKGGDPLVFSRAGEEMEAAQAAGIPVEIIPGVTTAQAAAAALGVPLTHRHLARRLQLVTGHDHQGALPEGVDWRALADPAATTVVYMPKKTLSALSDAVRAEGLPANTPAAAVMDATLSTQRVIHGTIATLPALLETAQMEGPVIVVIGAVLAKLL